VLALEYRAELCVTFLVLLELFPELLELFFQIVDFFLEFADSIRLSFGFGEAYFTRKKMRITDFLLAALPRQADNERGLACHERIQSYLHFLKT